MSDPIILLLSLPPSANRLWRNNRLSRKRPARYVWRGDRESPMLCVAGASFCSSICGRPSPRKTFLRCFDQIACVHMSGLLLRSHMNAGQDGFRDAGSKQKGDLERPLELSECPVSWID